MTLLKKVRRAAGEVASKVGKKTPDANVPQTWPDTPEGKMEAACHGLRASLAQYEQGIRLIADADVSMARIDKEVRDYLETVDPSDERAVGIVSGKQAQLKLMPIYREREERKLDERGKALGNELGDVLKAILVCAADETKATRVFIEDAIRPWFPTYRVPADPLHGLPERDYDPVPHLAAGSALVFDGLHVGLTLPPTWQRPEGDRLYRDEANARSYDRTLTERAKFLLGIYQAWLDNGRRFLRNRLPDLGRSGFRHESGTWNGEKPAAATDAAQSQSAVSTLPDAENAS